MRIQSVLALAAIMTSLVAARPGHAQAILGAHGGQAPYFGYPYPTVPFVYPRAYGRHGHGGYQYWIGPYGYPYQPGFYFQRGFGPRAYHRGHGIHGFTLRGR
ncbi:MAG TPA: hypothetical protein VNO26_14050 [Candidatus Limnocylindria bacterium]|nr:hypothetical protein [Candidatus Limnocylindria bacterium]